MSNVDTSFLSYVIGFVVFFAIGVFDTSRFGSYRLAPGENGWIFAGLMALVWPFTLVIYAVFHIIVPLWGSLALFRRRLQRNSDSDSSDSD